MNNNLVNKYIPLVDEISNKYNYNSNIKHLLYLIIPAFITKYTYKEERLIGLKNWYQDYMTCNVDAGNGKKIGLDEIVYTLTPPAESDFEYAVEVEYSKEPQNIIEEIKNLFKTV